MTRSLEPLSDALRRMPVPPLRPDFVDAALSRATATQQTSRTRFGALARWETWFGAAAGAAVAIVATVLVMLPQTPIAPAAGITLALDESRNIDVLIDSERTLDDATIRVATTGAVELDGFDDRDRVEWRTRLERGRNVLSLPVVARSAGTAQLVATIEHHGRSRRVAIQLLVKPRSGKSA